jgi:phage terminase small subunit
MAKEKRRGTSKRNTKAVSTDTAKSVSPKLTPKQRRFAANVVTADSATQAALQAGYSPKNAAQQACENLKKPNIRDAIESACEKLGIGPEYVLAGLKANAERAMQYEEVKDAEGRGIGEFVYQGNVANKAYELMMKAQGMLTDKVEHSGRVDTTPTLDYSKYTDQELETLEALLAKQG